MKTICLSLLFYLFLQPNAFSELRLSLNKSQYQTLKKRFPQPFSKRFDLYIEAFNGKNFLLEKNKVKFRIKNSKKKSVIQVSKEVEEKSLKCGPHKVSWKKRIVYESKSKDLVRLLLFKGYEIFKYINSHDILPLNLALDFDFQIRALNFKGKELLFQTLNKKEPYILVPSHTNKKYRKKRTLKLGKGKRLHIVLGKTLEKGKNGLFITTYEMEGEGDPLNSEKKKHYLKSFCRYLKKIAPSNQDASEEVGEKDINLELYINKMPSFIFKKKKN